MSHSVNNNYTIRHQQTIYNATPSNCCAKASAELKLYQAFIFSVPIFFTFILLFLFYLFYLRRRRVDWSSLRMRTTNSIPSSESSDDISRLEVGLKKEFREMLPIIVFKESFSVKDTQCSVCLVDYQAEDKLQQIPTCGHTFHMDCIDLWLATHTTCPLCRQCLLPSPQVEDDDRPLNGQDGDETSLAGSSEEPQTSQPSVEPRNNDGSILTSCCDENVGGSHQHAEIDSNTRSTKNEAEAEDCKCNTIVVCIRCQGMR